MTNPTNDSAPEWDFIPTPVDKWTRSWFTAEENRFWLSGEKVARTEKFLSEVNSLHKLGFTVRAYRNKRKYVNVCVGIMKDDKFFVLGDFEATDRGVVIKGNRFFSKRLDYDMRKRVSDNRILPIGGLVRGMTQTLMRHTQGGTSLPEAEFSKIGPMLLFYSYEDAKFMYDNGLGFFDVCKPYTLGLTREEIVESRDVPSAFLESMYKDRVKPTYVTDSERYMDVA
jgi:hypothetical protein